MNNQEPLHYIQKLAHKLQRALEEQRPRINRARSDPDTLEDPERVRRSAAPSPEAFLGEDHEPREEGLTGAVGIPSHTISFESIMG